MSEVLPVSEGDITLIEEKAAAEQEWADVERTQNERAHVPITEASFPPPAAIEPPLVYEEAVAHFMSLDLSENKKKIVTEDPRSKGFFSSFMSLFFSSSSLSSKLIPERDSIFAIALIAFDNGDRMHNRLLQSCFMILQGTKEECPRIGPHWEEIGFQGDDPATDLRGVGMFGTLQLFHLINNHKTLAKTIHKISRDEKQCFPFSVVSLNFTKVAIQTLRSGNLTAKINKRGAVLPVLNELHIGLYYELYTHWKRGHHTISDFPPLLKDLTEKCTKSPNKVLATFKAYRLSLLEPAASSATTPSAAAPAEPEKEFSSI